jgi:hypothetical protein
MNRLAKRDFDNTLGELRYARGCMVRYGLRPPRRCQVCAIVEDENTMVIDDDDGDPICERCVLFAHRRLDLSQ